MRAFRHHALSSGKRKENISDNLHCLLVALHLLFSSFVCWLLQLVFVGSLEYTVMGDQTGVGTQQKLTHRRCKNSEAKIHLAFPRKLPKLEVLSEWVNPLISSVCIGAYILSISFRIFHLLDFRIYALTATERTCNKLQTNELLGEHNRICYVEFSSRLNKLIHFKELKRVSC